MKHKLLTLFVLLALLLAGLPARPVHAAGSTIYVDADSTCLFACGSSWLNSHKSLQTALAAASSGDQIWVAEGVYYPGAAGDRAATFTLKNGVKVYGGFDGTEDRLTDRNFEANLTILSGDIDRNDINTDGNSIAETTTDIVGDNAYHVVRGSGLDSAVRLDGFIITSGLANDVSELRGGGLRLTGALTLSNLIIIGNRATEGGGLSTNQGNMSLSNVTFKSNKGDFYAGGMQIIDGNPTLVNVLFDGNIGNFGGGMLITSAKPVLTNVTFKNNHADFGGGITTFGNNSEATLTNVTFSGNSAESLGGGMYHNQGHSILTNVTFSGNTSNQTAGGMFIDDSPSLFNVTFSDNSASGLGGGVYLPNAATPTVVNTIIANSLNGGDCVTSGGAFSAQSTNNLIEDSAYACELANGVNGNIVGLEPQLVPLANNGGSTLTHALLPASPAIDAGDNTSCPATDQRGNARPNGLYCDIGAFEGEPHPYIISITRTGPNATTAASVDFDIVFSEPVDNVHDYDFQVTTTGTISGAEVTGITGNTTNGTVTVSTGTGTGTIRLDIPVGVGIVDSNGNLLSGLPYTSGETYSVRPQTFADVPMSFWSWNFIERLYLTGITGGCGSGNYCPASPVTRAQMSVFLLVAKHGPGYVPPSASGIFNDVPADNGFARWIEQLATEGITGGCGGGNYCPNSPVTREQMAVFLLVAEHGMGYTPPAATGIFNDVPASYPFAPWIEQLAAEGITGGCGGGNFCPAAVVNRGQMAVFLVTSFNLP